MSASTTVEEPSDDASSIVEYLGNTSRAYRNQVLTVIGLCRLFSRFVVQGVEQDIERRTVLKTCDEILCFVAHSGHRANHKTDDRFQSAIEALSTCAIGFCPGIDLVRVRMRVAKWRDAMSYEVLPPPGLMLVNFVVFRTLPDPKPILVSLMLSHSAGIEEVLWNFTQFEDERRITLHDNPHFYSDLPTSFDAYTARFRALPIDNFAPKPNATIYVLVDQPRRVFLETRHNTRIFGSVFVLNDVMIFKDIHGALEGESVVGESIWGMPNLWCNEKFPAIPDSTKPAHDMNLWPIMTANPTAKCTTKDRRDLVRTALGSGDGDLRIYVRKLPSPWIIREKFLPPPAPTTERPGYDLLYTTIDTLNVDILLAIFNFYRLEDKESWNLQLRWCKLSHVCREWRYLIYQSFFHLDMHILFRNGTPSLDMLSHLPPLPLVIDYCGNVDDDDSILHAIQHSDRILRIILLAPSSSLDRLAVFMDEPFPRLETLSLLSTTESNEGTSVTLPRTFLTPNLRHLSLCGISLPKGLPLLASTFSLVTIKLTDIQSDGYFTPEVLVTQLQHIPHLEGLSIGFSTPLPRPDGEGEVLRAPITLRTLPALRWLSFRGISVYLEGLIARIASPRLERFDITLFNQLNFTLPHLSHFTRTNETLRHPVANVIFSRESVSFVVGSRDAFSEDPFSLHISCKPFDWQLVSAMQICGALVTVLSVAEELTLEFDGWSLPSNEQDAIDAMEWHGLLWPFNSIKKLRIGHPLAWELSSALEAEAEDAGLVLDPLPELQELEAQVEVRHLDKAFATFVDARRVAGHSVSLSVSPVVISTTVSSSSGSTPTPDASEHKSPVAVLLPTPGRRNWFRTAVVEPVRRRFRTRARAGG